MSKIITDLSELSVPSEPITFLSEAGVDKTEALEIIEKIKEAFSEDQSLIAVSAPQIGIKKRVFGIRFDDSIKIFLNPIVIKKSGAVILPEIFSSMPNKEILLSRPKEITVVYYTEEFKYEENKLLDAAARIFDQMSQVLDGVLPSDLGLVSDVTEDGSLFDLEEEELLELCEMYKKFVGAKLSQLETEINSDEEEKKIYNQLRFTESVINGRTQVVQDNIVHMNRAQRRAAQKAFKKKRK